MRIIGDYYFDMFPHTSFSQKNSKKLIDMFPHTSGSKISQRHQFHQLEPRGVRSFDVKGKQIKGEKKAIKLLETFEYLKSATTRLYDTEAKIICIVSKKGAQCIECHHKDI